MIDMHSKYDNMHNNGMFYALIYINNYIIACYQMTWMVLGSYRLHQQVAKVASSTQRVYEGA